jgi:transcription-repair coupling factor (superfamily II helicase)
MEIDQELTISQDMQLQKIKEEVIKKFAEYEQSVKYMAADAPISILCLQKAVENKLIENNILRVYDLFNMDLAKVEWLNASGVRHLTASLNQFLAMF